MSNELHKKYLLLGFVSVCNFGTAYMWSHALCNNSEQKKPVRLEITSQNAVTLTCQCDYLQLISVLNSSICLQGSQDKQQKAKLLESLYSENHKLSSLCGILFPQNSQSVWSGPHSLIQKRNSARTSSIHAAIRTFMGQLLS